jgi:hypothetical protein
MTERLLADERFLESALRDLGASLEVPPGAGLPAAVADRVAALPAPGRAVGWRRIAELARTGWGSGRPARRALVLALVALVVLVAVVAAIALGVPGIRIVIGPTPTASGPVAPSGSGSIGASGTDGAAASSSGSGLLGEGQALGSPVPVATIDQTAGFHVSVPSDPSIGPPSVAWFDPAIGTGHVALVWPGRPGLPPDTSSGIGLLIAEFPARIDETLFQKNVPDPADVVRVLVGDATGYWIGGAHELLYLTPSGEVVPDRQRRVGPVLVWSKGGITYRIESGLGRDAAIALAETLR